MQNSDRRLEPHIEKQMFAIQRAFNEPNLKQGPIETQRQRLKRKRRKGLPIHTNTHLYTPICTSTHQQITLHTITHQYTIIITIHTNTHDIHQYTPVHANRHYTLLHIITQ